MSANLKNFSPLLRSSRMFPDDTPQALSVQVDRAYLETAYAVNNRIIGVYGSTYPLINGMNFFIEGRQVTTVTYSFDNIKGRKLGGQRQVFEFDVSTPGFNNITHNLDLTNIVGFPTISGWFSDGTTNYPLPFLDGTTIGNSVGLSVSSTQITFLPGATAPVPVYGFVILEWLSTP